MIKLIATRLTTPEIEGFPDKIDLINTDTNILIITFLRFGTNPNELNPHTMQKWTECEGQLAPGKYNYKCWLSPKHGKCLKLNDLGVCATTNINMSPDTKYPGTKTAESVEIHTGYRADEPNHPGCRGSLCCQTISPDCAEDFWSYFNIGDKGDYILNEKIS